jgi:hypothetical protein
LKNILILLFALGLPFGASAQITIKGVSVPGSTVVGSNGLLPPALAQLPQVWANDHECPASNGTFDSTKHIPADFATVNAAWTAWQADGIDDSWLVIVAHGTTIGPITALAKLVGGNMPTKCFVVDSDTPLPAGRTVCSHGIQDNVATSTDIGLRNPDCNGTGMSYQLGQTLTSISPGAFTLANGLNTNTSAYNDVGSMFTIECNTTNCASVVTGSVDANGNGPNHFAIYDAEIRVNTSKTCCFTVDMENAGATTQSLPSHYHFDRIWAHSDATDAGAGAQSLTDYIRLNCGGNCTLSNSQTSKGIRPGAEGHAIYWGDAGQIKIVHNWIEGMSIGIFDGGQSVSVPGGVSGRDAEIRRNRLTYPLPWLGVAGICGASCVRKNCFEEKGALRYLFDGNICENVDNSGGQNGTITDWNNRACTPSVCNNYVQTIQDITISNDIYRHGCGGLLFDANSGNAGSSGNSASTPSRNFFMQNVLIYDVSIYNFGCGVTTNGTFYLGGTNHNFTVSSVTRNAGGTISTIVLAGGTGENQTGLVNGDPITLSGCADATFNAGPYPFVTALTVSGTTITYSNPGTPNATSAGCVFDNGAGWPNFMTADHVTAIAYWNIEVGNNLTAINATFPRNQTYSNSIYSGTRGFGIPGGTEGTAFENAFLDTATLLAHHTIFSGRNAPVWQANTAYKLGQIVQPTGTPSHFYTAVTSGTSGSSQPAFSGSTLSCVTDGTVTWQENGFRIGQTGGLPSYTEYQSLNTPISPPTTLFFPQTDFTYGASADATSIGFAGALNSSTSGSNSCVSGTAVKTMNPALDLADWHGYALDSSSAYKGVAVGSSDPGADISAIEAAQNSTQYICKSPCGSGPTPD